MAYAPHQPPYYPEPQSYYPEQSSPGASPYYHQPHHQSPYHHHQPQQPQQPLHHAAEHQKRQQHGRQEIQEQISRHHDLELGLDRMEERSRQQVPSLAQVVMQECHEAKIRRQNRQIAISAGVTIGLIVLVIWFVASR